MPSEQTEKSTVLPGSVRAAVTQDKLLPSAGRDREVNAGSHCSPEQTVTS